MSGAVAFEARSLAEHIAAEEAPPAAAPAAPAPAQEPAKPAEPTPPAAPAAAPAADDAAKAEEAAKVAATEANSTKPDAELSEAARTLRKNRLDERTKRLRVQNDELARELQRRQDLNRQRSESERESRPAQAAVAPDPTDPEPTFESFVAAHPTHPDPYAGFISARTRWEIRQEQRTTQATQAREQQTAQAREQGVKLAGHLQAGQQKFSDFDAVTEPVIQAISAGSPQRDADFTRFVIGSAVGGDLLYQLGTNSAALQAVLDATDPTQLFRALHAVEARITGPAPAAAAPPPISQAPPPPSAVAGGASSAASSTDTRQVGFSTADHIRIEQAELDARRARGLRN